MVRRSEKRQAGKHARRLTFFDYATGPPHCCSMYLVTFSNHDGCPPPPSGEISPPTGEFFHEPPPLPTTTTTTFMPFSSYLPAVCLIAMHCLV